MLGGRNSPVSMQVFQRLTPRERVDSMQQAQKIGHDGVQEIWQVRVPGLHRAGTMHKL